MRKVVLVIALAASLVATGAAADIQYHIRVNGKEISTSPPPFTVEGRLFVPLRAVSEALGAEVTYDPASFTASISLPNSSDQLAGEVQRLQSQAKANDAILNGLISENERLRAEFGNPVKAQFPGLSVSSAYVSLALNGDLSDANLKGFVASIYEGRFDRFDGVHLMTSTGVITIHGPDLQAWKNDLITAEQFIARWVFPTQSSTPIVTVPVGTSDVIESQIDGDFEGWDGDTIFQLTNGQIWQQVSYAYHYHYAFMPKVLIYKSGSVYKMKVTGVDKEITVKRLK